MSGGSGGSARVPRAPRDRGGAGRGLRALALAALSAYAVAVAVGALTAPVTVLLAAAVAALLLVVVPVAADPGLTAADRPRHLVLALVAAVAGLGPFLAGVHGLGRAGQVLAAFVTASCGALVVHALLHPEQARAALAAAPPPAGPTAPGTAGLPELLGALTLEALCEEWNSLQRRCAQGDARSRAEASTAAALVLGELRRRNPDGVERWLREDPGAPPDHHLRARPPETAP
ncbi:hypothetical protein [Kineococcus gypseus]|uniref:hypothetical protein n=1 Tax=Kineococcus gypseus TaxID=1637102 RepID=UPI003D7D209E